MLLIELLSHNLRHGDRVRLTCASTLGEEKTIECFFAGWRIMGGGNTTRTELDIMPVFREITKNGKMSNRKIDAWPVTENIVHIAKVNAAKDEAPYYESNDYCSAYLAYHNIAKTARAQFTGIVGEMAKLFPGKKIRLDPTDEMIPCIDYNGEGPISCEITAIGYAEGKVVVDILDDVGPRANVPVTHLTNIDYVDLLDALLAAIRFPAEDSFLEKGCGWTDVPDPREDVDNYPLLAAAGILTDLKANMWLESLTEEQKEKVLDTEPYKYMHARHLQNNPEESEATTPFLQWAEDQWYNTNRTSLWIKRNCFYKNTKKD